MATTLELLRRASAASAPAPAPARSGDPAALIELADLARRGEVPAAGSSAGDLRSALLELLNVALTWRGAEGLEDAAKVQLLLWPASACAGLAAANASEASDLELPSGLLRTLTEQLDGTSPPETWPLLRDVLLWLYDRFPKERPGLRRVLCKPLLTFQSMAHKRAPIQPILQVLAAIIRGFQMPLMQVHKSLLTDVLLPLHKPNDWAVWDRQTPLVALYHKELVICMELILDQHPTLAATCIEAVLSHLPKSFESNTPKEVLMLFEISRLFRFLTTAGFRQALPQLLRHMVRLLASQNAQTLQAVLQFWKDAKFLELSRGASAQMVPALLPVLLRGGEAHWNPTVNRMTALVLEEMEASAPAEFQEAAERHWGPGGSVPAFELAAAARAEAEAAEQAEEEAANAKKAKAPAPNVSSLKFGMGGWKPPGSGGVGGGQPPVTVTGVAPWAMQGANGGAGGRLGAMGMPRPGALGGGGASAQPPLTTTGVAPWAFQSKPPGGRLGGGGVGMGRPPMGALGSFAEEASPQSSTSGAGGSSSASASPAAASAQSGLERIHVYLRRLCPEGSGGEGGSQPSWEAALHAESPTLLPTLKFHDLVFGNTELGTGAFSVVKYVRAIQKATGQSQWPEYAVKVINTKTMQELGYEGSVNREICVLRMLSHPNVARMVSSFIYRDGAYLVLEYAKKGDLHSILLQMGKLPLDTARFFVGEVIAALNAIHGIGFVYADLKPENIVITAANHAKLTDFGGCRPINEEARERTRESLVKRLRDGDWRAQDDPEVVAHSSTEDENLADAVNDDARVEGTTMYLPPEVIRGSAPTLAADAWALGCLVLQLLIGRPPVYVDSEQEEDLRAYILQFKAENAPGFADLAESARNLAAGLLEPDLNVRKHVADVASEEFFEGLDIFTLYRRPRGPHVVAAGDGGASAAAAASGDARWQKRQFSKIWTVAPTAQDYVSAPPRALPPGVAGASFGPPTSVAEAEIERSAPFGEAPGHGAGLPPIRRVSGTTLEL